MSTRPRLCPADKSSSTSRTSTAQKGRVLLRCRNLSHNELEEILRGQFVETQAPKKVGRQNNLFAGAQCRGGQCIGGNGGRRREIELGVVVVVAAEA